MISSIMMESHPKTAGGVESIRPSYKVGPQYKKAMDDYYDAEKERRTSVSEEFVGHWEGNGDLNGNGDVDGNADGNASSKGKHLGMKTAPSTAIPVSTMIKTAKRTTDLSSKIAKNLFWLLKFKNLKFFLIVLFLIASFSQQNQQHPHNIFGYLSY
ncbi:MAG: hypothetical protein R6U96_03865 [Promethearchaeia archaeon]